MKENEQIAEALQKLALLRKYEVNLKLYLKKLEDALKQISKIQSVKRSTSSTNRVKRVIDDAKKLNKLKYKFDFYLNSERKTLSKHYKKDATYVILQELERFEVEDLKILYLLEGLLKDLGHNLEVLAKHEHNMEKRDVENLNVLIGSAHQYVMLTLGLLNNEIKLLKSI